MAVLSNLNGGAPGEIAAKLLALVHGEKVVLPNERKEIEVSPDVIRRYVGTYSLVPGDVTFTEEKGTLIMQAGEGMKRPFAAESETRYFLRQPEIVVEFGEKSVTLFQGGQQFKGTRR